MKIDTRLFGEVAVLTLVGELDSRGHQQLDKEIRELIDGRVYKVILDLSSIRFMGQQTISLLISHMKELRANGGDVRFLNPQRSLMQYLKQNRVIELFNVYSTRAEAVDSYTTGQEAVSSPARSTPSTAGDIKPAPSGGGTYREAESAESDSTYSLKSRFETGEILYANSCMLATLIRVLESKGVLSSEEASELMDYERVSTKGADE